MMTKDSFIAITNRKMKKWTNDAGPENWERMTEIRLLNQDGILYITYIYLYFYVCLRSTFDAEQIWRQDTKSWRN